MRSPLSKAKLTLYRYLPSRVFDTIYSLWSVYAKYQNNRIISNFNNDFKERNTVILNQLGIEFPIVVDPKNGALDMTILSTGEYEPNIAEVIRRFVKPGNTVIDVGANIGVHALYMAKLGATVHAFEPVTQFRKQFEESLTSDNYDITLHPFALGEKEEAKIIYTSKTNAAISSFMVNPDPESTEVVQIKALDSLNLSPSFMKIDVEGFEEDVIWGALNTIKSCKPVILFEYSPLFYRNMGRNPLSILFTLEVLGYRMFDIEDNDREITDIDEFVKEFAPRLRGQTNIYCTPR